MELDLEQEQIKLIKKIITSNKKYANNEDLFDDFFNETCKRALSIVKTIKNEASLEIYLQKIATTSILQVLKDSGRVKRTYDGYVKHREERLDSAPAVTTPISNSGKYSNIQVNYDVIDLSDGPEELAIKKEILQRMYDAVTFANSSAPERQFLSLYNLRYIKGMKQKQIADELNISQSEVSKRLLELMSLVKNTLNNG